MHVMTVLRVLFAPCVTMASTKLAVGDVRVAHLAAIISFFLRSFFFF